MNSKSKVSQANINQTLFGINVSSSSSSSSSVSKHDILTFKPIKRPSTNTKLYYDVHYKRIIAITTDNMKIYNRTFTKEKKNCDLIITNEYLNKITTNKQMTYALFYLICNPTPLIMCADLNTCEFTFMLKEQFDTLLNMFFINESDFCLVYTYQLEFYSIEKTSLNIVNKLVNVNYIQSNYLIQSYSYCYHIKILIVLLSDNSFQLFNLKERKLYHQPIKTFKEPFNLQGISLEISYFNGKRLSSLFNTHKKLNDANDKIINNNNNSYNIISKNQFYMEKIYEQFYFVFLSYEKYAIYFMELSDLFSFPKSAEHSIVIEYKHHNRNSYLYFSDNLVFAINFAKKEIVIIDLHCNDKNKTLAKCSFNSKVFSNVNEFMPIGGIFKAQQQQDLFYYLYFNKELYYNKLSNKLKIKCLFDMSRRKHFKEFIIAKITDILTNSSSSSSSLHHKHTFNISLKHSALVKFIDVMQEYENIAMQLANMNCNNNNNNNSEHDIDHNRTVYSKHQVKPIKYEIERPTGLELLSKKQPILQSDLYTLVIHPIYEQKKYVSLEELLYIIYGFKCELNNRNIRVNGNFYVMMNCIILDISKEMNVFRYHALIANVARYNMGEIAEQLLQSANKANYVYKEVIVLAIEILLSFNKYYEVLEYLILNDNDIKKGIQFLMEYWKLLKQQQHKLTIKKLLCNAIINQPHKREVIIELLKHK